MHGKEDLVVVVSLKDSCSEDYVQFSAPLQILLEGSLRFPLF